MNSVTIKLDMSKAYDRVERIFLEKIMLKQGFHLKWVGWLKECMEIVSYSFLLEGKVTGRQGHGLSQT